ncbi:hypothetical protein CA54_40510 [Symmachiella macrocystis]|uniref:Uncharacterized protein n=1 Tax=Symmachiella macrocystis TaxID=2527985 RepID=A0A5C6BED2_9PLAN|nr:hypothetical protein CA54_40510 [Symmachiella macrocystis]
MCKFVNHGELHVGDVRQWFFVIIKTRRSDLTSPLRPKTVRNESCHKKYTALDTLGMILAVVVRAADELDHKGVQSSVRQLDFGVLRFPGWDSGYIELDCSNRIASAG